MRTSLLPADLADYTRRQIGLFFPDAAPIGADWPRMVARALERVELCFSRIHQRYYRDDGGQPVFSHLNTDQYAAYLYLLSNTVVRETRNHDLAAKLYGLNKALHGLDVFYEVELPEVFVFFHPVGSVIGRATYGNYLCVYQNCTIGGDLEGNHPSLGEGVVLFGGARVIGTAVIGSNCLLSAGTIVLNQHIPDGQVVFGISPKLTYRPTPRNVKRELFGIAPC